MFSELLQGVFGTPEINAAVCSRAWLQGMLDFESALARTEARLGLIPTEAAAAIARCCDADRFDPAVIGSQAAEGANPAIPLIERLSAAVPAAAAGYVHWGATSQDVIDTGLMLVVRRALPLVLADLAAIEGHCARLAREHAETVMPARTLLQQALPTTFGLKAAGWLAQIRRVRADLEAVQRRDLAVQFGGAAGTLASLGSRGVEVLEGLGAELALTVPELPWHTARDRFIRVQAALGLVGGAVGKIALDVILLMQSEVGEVAEARPGGSSTLPHKRNPAGSTMALAAAECLAASMGGAFAGALQAHERAVGQWHAEWERIGDALRLTAAAVRHVREVLAELRVAADRMRANLAASGGLMMAEAVMMTLAPYVGRGEAHRILESACREAASGSRSLEAVLGEQPEVVRHLRREQIAAALDPANYLGSTRAFIERVLAPGGEQEKQAGADPTRPGSEGGLDGLGGGD